MFRLLEKWVGWFAAVISEFNAMRAALQRFGALAHNAPTALVETANATNTATAITLANALKAAWNAHAASTAAHIAADATNVVTSPDATNQGTLNTLINEIKADFNAHHASGTFHHVGGAGGLAVPANVATTDASDEATSVALANAMKAAINRHFGSGVSAASSTD